jgi:hypothetical protein
MFISRRTSFAAAALATTALVGCTTAAPVVTSTLSTLAAGWANISNLLAASGIALPASVTNGVTAAIADLEANAAKIVTAVGAPPTTVQQIVTDITTVSSLVAAFYPPASVIGTLVAAGVSLIGTLLSEAGIAAAAANAPAAPFEPAAALMILKGAVAK